MSKTQQNTEDGNGTGMPTFIERGERDDAGSWDYYECPREDCEFPLCSFCDCPECGWYDEDAWEDAIRETAHERDDIYTGSLDVSEKTNQEDQ